jgi:hypothetical protein
MIKQSPDHPRRHFWQIALLLLVIIPFLPEITILVTAAVADIMGWNQKGVCTFESAPVTNIITLSLELATGLILAGIGTPAMWRIVLYAGLIAWLCLCLITASLGWASTRSRLLIGFAVTIVFAFLPYFAPMLAIEILANDNCRPNEAGVGACVMFGGYVGNTDRAVAMGWLAGYGVPLALGVFAIYATVIIIVGVSSRKRVGATVQ